jgi:CelD/BcsL family acetyltransferase involved in cellulose biosynthesis
MLTTRHASGRTALSDVGSAYDALCQQTCVPVTSRRRWLQAWADSYSDWDPWVVTVHDGDELVACAPLARRRSGPLTRVVGMGHGPTDDFRLPARDTAAAAQLAESIATALPRPWLLVLDQVPGSDPAVAALAGRLPGAQLRPGEGMPVVRITERDESRYLSKNTRKALAKIRNKLAAAGIEPEIGWETDAVAIRAALPELSAVHQARDRALGRRSDHADPRAAAFFAAVIGRHADAGEVELLTVRMRGELAAYVCAFRDGSALRSWDNRLAPEWADYSAGRIANTETLLRVVRSPDLDELDWMQGEEPYKLQSATEVVPTSVLVAWSSPWVRRAHSALEQARDAKRGSEALTRAWWAVRGVRDRFRTGTPASRDQS